MNEDLRDMIVDLRIKEASVGLDNEERDRLAQLCADAGAADDLSYELAAAAVGLSELKIDEQMPAHLRSRILETADEHFGVAGRPAVAKAEDDIQPVFTVERPRRSWNWLGWAIAGAACILLAVNIWQTRVTPPNVVVDRPPVTPAPPTREQEFARLLSAPSGVTKASWAAGNVKDLKDVSGDVVWSDDEQKGFMRLRGLPVNDANKETYQLWIFDKTQDKATPIDGGTFDIDKQGEVIIPIDAKLRAREPGLFAITIEKPGGVVVSKREKIAALATVETPKTSQS